MAKLYLLGGENVATRSASEINRKAFEDAGCQPTVLVFAWAKPSFEKAYQRRRLLQDYFRSLGASKVDFAEYSDTSEAVAEKVHKSQLIYFPGGGTSILIERLKNKNIDRLLSRYEGVVVGRSAGALALCRESIVTNKNNRASKLVKGLGLADLCVKAHYKPRNDEVLMMLSKKLVVHAVAARSAISVDKGKLGYFGRVYMFQDGQKFLLQNPTHSL